MTPIIAVCPPEEMQQSFEQSALIKLRTAVDLDEYLRLECFVRGDDTGTFTRRNWRLQLITEPVSTWRRVLLLMQFKPESELTEAQKKAP